MKVLIASNDTTFVPSLAAAYRGLGWVVDTGLQPFVQPHETYDLIHCQWPEELVGFKQLVSNPAAEVARKALAYWSNKTVLLCTVHNLLPHGVAPENLAWTRFYSEFYSYMHHLGHFTNTSLEQVCHKFSGSPRERHFVHGMNLFEDVRAEAPTREEARKRFGLYDEECAIVTFGQIRSRSELKLLHQGLAGALPRIERPHKLLMAARLDGSWRSPRKALDRAWHKFWSHREGAAFMPGRLTTGETGELLMAADALVISRLGRQLNSGLIPLAMTFGTALAIPDGESFKELLSGSDNVFYRSGDAASLSTAIVELLSKDLELARVSNLERSKGWGWSKVVERVCRRVGYLPKHEAGLRV